MPTGMNTNAMATLNPVNRMPNVTLRNSTFTSDAGTNVLNTSEFLDKEERDDLNT